MSKSPVNAVFAFFVTFIFIGELVRTTFVNDVTGVTGSCHGVEGGEERAERVEQCVLKLWKGNKSTPMKEFFNI